jgi:hypothetical protein
VRQETPCANLGLASATAGNPGVAGTVRAGHERHRQRAAA